jgi:hypothetical protein
MSKGFAVTLLAVAFVVVVVAPALATKDPFKPLVTSGTSTTSTTTTQPSTTGQDEPAVIGVPEENPTSESMPTTGSDVSSWLVLSYALVVAGGAAWVLARTLRPARW